MNEIEAIRRDLGAALDGDPWHGSSLETILAGIDEEVAAAHPVPGRHSAWEITLHLAAWAGEVARRVRGETPALPPEGDWPPVPILADADAWAASLMGLHRAHAELDAALQNFPASRLDEQVGADRDAPLGTGVTWRQTLLGVLQHDAYHGGQIALLAAMQRRG
jgi:hypothetical protein